jgi:tetratricopeptide (TPR) repeat protein
VEKTPELQLLFHFKEDIIVDQKRQDLNFRKTMCIRNFSTCFLICMTISASAQMELLPDALTDYLKFSDRLRAYENVAVDWTKGQATQADLNEGLNNLLENNPSVAESDFSKVIETDPKIWQAYYYRSICFKQLEKFPQARKDIEHVLKTQPSLYEGHLELGKILQLTFYMKEAESSFDKAIKIAPEKATAYYLKGNIQLLQKDKKSAAVSYHACLKNDNSFHDAQMRLGLLEDKIDATVPYFNIVLQTDSLNRHALLIRSILTFKSNQQQCLSDLNKLVRVSPGNLMALYLRGHLLTDREDYTRAFSDFRKVIKETYADDNTFKGKQTWLDKKIDIQNAGAYAISRLYGLPDEEGDKIKKAYCLLVTGSYSDCVTTLQRTLNPGRDPLCLYLTAVACEHGRAHEEALGYYERALSFDNDILDAHKKRGIYMQELKNWISQLQISQKY